MSIFDTQNPGIGGLKELTATETLVVQEIAALGSPAASRILGYDFTDGNYAYFLIGSGLTYTHSTHTLSVSSTGTVSSVASADNSVTITNPTTTVDLSVASSPKLTTARTIAGVSFDGTGNIAIPASGLSNGVTGSGAVVLASSPTITTAVLGSSTATTQTPGDNSTKLATTAYVDSAILGQNYKEACKYATTTALATLIYANGSSGVGATLTEVSFGALSIDGSTPSVGDRILVKNQVSTFQNGIYVVTVVGTAGTVFVLTRATDTNQTQEFKTGDSVFVTSGTANSATTWAYSGIDSPTIGTDAITFSQTAGQGSFTQGNGIAITGVSIAVDLTVVVDKTTAQTLTNKTLTTPKIVSLYQDSIGGSNLLTMPAATDTLIGKATTDTLTNKTYDTAGTGNTFKINGVTISANTGTGSNVLATSPTLVTPVLGVATVTSLAAATNNSISMLSGTYNTIQTYTPTAAGTATLDLSKGNIHHITMPAGNITVALSNGTAGQCFLVRFLQDGTGSRTTAWFTTIKWAGGSAPTLTTTASKADTIGFEITGSSTYDGFVVGQNL